MTDEQQRRLALALIQLRDARARVPHEKPPEREPFYDLKAEERAAVLALDHVPHTLEEIQTTLRRALPGRVVLIEDYYVGGRGYGNFDLQIGDQWLTLDEDLDPDHMGLYRIRLPEGEMTQETGALFTKPNSTILVLPMAANWMVVARRFEDTLRGLGVDQVLPDEELAALARRLAAETANTVYVAWLQP